MSAQISIAHVNLIPRERREASRRRVRLRAWCWGCSTYATVIVALVLGVRVGSPGTEVESNKALSRISASMEKSRAQAAVAQTELQRVQSQLTASHAVGSQPDWSVLLALLASVRGDEVVLKRCELALIKDVRAATDDGAGPGRLRLELSALGRSQRAVSGFVLRLEDSGLFRQVTLIDTQRETFGDDFAVAFRLECDLNTVPSKGRTTS